MNKFLLGGLLSFLIPVSAFTQSTYRYINKYFLLEIQYPQQDNKINILRLALIPKKNDSKIDAGKVIMDQLESINFNTIGSRFYIYNFVPQFPDSYSNYRQDTSDHESKNVLDTSLRDKFYMHYLNFLANNRRLNIVSEIVVLHQDSILIKLSELKGKIHLVSYEAGIDILYRNRKIRENYSSRPDPGLNEFILNDVFLPCKSRFILQGGESDFIPVSARSTKTKALAYCNKDFVNRKSLSQYNFK